MQPETSGEVDVIEDYLIDGDVLAIFCDNSNPNEDWVLDSSCAFHMCPNQDLFSTYETISKGVKVMWNNVRCRVVIIGKVRLKLLDGGN